MKTIQDFAAILNGRQYRKEMTKEEAKEAKELGFVVMYGASDDILILKGAIDDEAATWEGATILFYKGKLLEAFARDLDMEVEDVQKVLEALGLDFAKVEVEWSPQEPECSWLIKPNVDFAPFDIFEDEELFCRGAVVEQRHLE